ncbi:MAG TPA: CueP family metal-binding protein, partial [Beutenbergiaceae bacterium]|nr:CueP family metal-binding protein [Beutenbergiaceae bacterium]
ESPSDLDTAIAEVSSPNARDLIDTLDKAPLDDRPTFTASIRPDAVIVEQDGQQQRFAMPDDEFYVAVAPYLNETHECTYHSLTTCVGEMGGEEVGVVVVEEDGDVSVDETQRTFDNGFIGLWLPRDVDATLTITHGEAVASAPISTRADCPTCITDMRLRTTDERVDDDVPSPHHSPHHRGPHHRDDHHGPHRHDHHGPQHGPHHSPQHPQHGPHHRGPHGDETD